ncbi:tryptophan synthase subunit alpha [Serpentinicella sp. ANB-PHB4]|uniref:tryptophan synthase subunit alpha n=1 Tax=Serpentinicella sp. ANB-PHB4 TaxID=3074076 RepID=UPI00285D9CB2|nr:tryptophan synthase subunit alpha [Serpentinicella sp. ANB-PHB4]MDR5659159.1 tryptophan synthase subunit alpha [Serpentinicella sp. ANB-PHB4]
MNKLEETFSTLKKQNRKAFMPFITAGFPNIQKTEMLIYALKDFGANIIELGIPYSDPLADGPVIQSANQIALDKGITIKDIFNCIEKVREKTKIPIVLLVYYNSILAYGIEKFLSACTSAEVHGLVVPDLPLEERDELLPYCIKNDIALIPLVSPTSIGRTKNIISQSQGFVYCVSSLGVTGSRKNFSKNTEDFLKYVREQTSLPLALGFGISSKEDVHRFKPYVDGIIVGSALIKKIDESNGNIDEIGNFVRSLDIAL